MTLNPKELIEILESKLQEVPSDQETMEQLAALLFSQGSIQRAEDLYTQILNVHPNSSNALWGLAKIQWQYSAFEKALDHMNLLINIQGNKLNKEQALMFSKLLAKSSMFGEASKWLDVAISQDSSLLQSEITYLKFIKQHLNIQNAHENGFMDGSNFKPISMGGVPVAQSGRNSHFIVVEISHIDASSTDLPFQIQEQNEPFREKEDLTQVRKPVTFEQVGGMDSVKQALIEEIVLPLKNPNLCSIYGKSTNPKVLLYGPSGCGKTYVCRALANEVDINFIALKVSDFYDLSFEDSEMRLAQILNFARDNKPSVIFIDEILWLGHSEGEDVEISENYFYRHNLINALTNALSGEYNLNSQIGLIATTSAPWKLDPKLLSSNKINKHIFVGPPSMEDRAKILSIILNGKNSPVVISEKIDCKKVVNSLKHIISGADLEELVDSALSDLLIETVVNIQLDNKEQKEKLILTTDRLISIGKNLKQVPMVAQWLTDAKEGLKTSNSALNQLWETIAESLPSGRGLSKSFLRSKLLPPK
jgi:ATP-dependent 26S proteasome regulatory subunit